MEKRKPRSPEDVTKDRQRISDHLLHVVNDASDYQNDFMVPLTRGDIYTIWEALRVVQQQPPSCDKAPNKHHYLMPSGQCSCQDQSWAK